MRDSLEERRGLSFAQAEGLEPLPRQLERKELTPRLRSMMWRNIHALAYSHTPSNLAINDVWVDLLKLFHSYHLEEPIDEYSGKKVLQSIKGDLVSGDYADFYGVLQFLLRCSDFSDSMAALVADTLEREHASYRIIERTLVPIGTEQEAQTIAAALTEAKSAGQAGAHAHLTHAVKAVAAGAFAECVNESIGAVEAVARTLTGEPSKLSEALAMLAQNGTIHGSLKKALTALYGYTSDEPGLRHCLLANGQANVDEADALLMLGTCSSFVSYILAKKRKSD